MLRFFRVSPARQVIVAGSTMRGEELPVLRAFRRVKTTAPGALLLLAPRHAERFDEADAPGARRGVRRVAAIGTAD